MKKKNQILLGIAIPVVIFIAVLLFLFLPWRSAEKEMTFTLINDGSAYEVNASGIENAIVKVFVGSNHGGDVVIPSEYNGLPVTKIGKSFMRNAKIKSVTIPDSVKYIEEGAFKNCSKLKSVTIPNGVISIGDDAFFGCDKLESVTVSDSVIRVGNDAFSQCEKLTDVTLSENIIYLGENAFGQIPADTSFVTFADAYTEIGGVYYVGNWVADADISITKAEIREGTVGIAEGAFANCTALTEISIPDSVKYVCTNAFIGCNKLQYTEDGNGKYLGNSENRYVVCMGPVSNDIETFEVNPHTNVIYGREYPDNYSKLDNYESKADGVNTSFYLCSKLGKIKLNGVDIIGEGAFNTQKLNQESRAEFSGIFELSYEDALDYLDWCEENNLSWLLDYMSSISE